MIEQNVIRFDKTNLHPARAIDLFKIMMRVEYALKACGHVTARGTQLDINWDDYANKKLGQKFFERVERAGIALTLINNPPSRQLLNAEGKLVFSGNNNKVRNVQELIGATRRVRNNLFHGGKSGDPDHDRNDALISEAISVVTEVLFSDDELRVEFEGLY